MALAPPERNTPGATPRSSFGPSLSRGAESFPPRERRDPTVIGPGRRMTDALLQRVCGEFLEMPGLRLTCQQAQRLWGLDEPTCREILDFLVDARFLSHAAHDDTYSRLTEGSAQPPRLGAGAATNRGAGPGRVKDTD